MRDDHDAIRRQRPYYRRYVMSLGAESSPHALRLAEASGEQRIDIVCVGDSLTGYNNFGEPWPLLTYPDFLQEMLRSEGSAMTIINAGQAGERSDLARALTERYLLLFPDSTHVIIGFGTNDLSRLDEDEAQELSPRIIDNLDAAIRLARAAGKKTMAFNVPHLNSMLFGKGTIARSRRIREYHNGNLATYCVANQVSLADICSRLKDEHFADGLHVQAPK